MKKLITIIMAIVMVAAFIPTAEAGDTAQLGLQVTFAPNAPLTIVSDPQGPFEVENGSTLEFRVIAEDKDTTGITLQPISLPEGAEWIDGVETLEWPKRIRHGLFRWTPKIESTANEIGYTAIFGAHNFEGEKVELKVEIRVINSIIAIELEGPNPWVLDGIKLGDKRNNFLNPDSKPIHWIRNTGNVPVLVDIGYGPQIDLIGAIHPGFEQGLDTFITMVGDVLIPPNERVKAEIVQPTATASLALTYGAPTALSQNAAGMSVTYELRAYKAIIEPIPDPAPNPGPKPIV